MKRPEIPTHYFRKDNGRWCISYMDPNTGKRIRESISTRKADAIKRSNQVYQDLMAEYLGEPDYQLVEITLEDLSHEFFQSKERRAEEITLRSYRAKARFLLAFIQNHFPTINTVQQIRTIYLEEFLTSRFEEGKAHRTVEADLQVVKALFNFAVERGYLAHSPALKIKSFKNPNQARRVQFWSKDEVRKILAEIKPGWRDAHEFLYNTGLRKAELMFLTWEDVVIDGDRSHIIIQAKEGWKPKNNKSRILPLNQSARELVSRQKKENMKDYIFKGPRGSKQLHRDKFYRELKRALKVIGLEGDVHKWRHTFASQLVMAGVGVETVSKQIGRASCRERV